MHGRKRGALNGHVGASGFSRQRASGHVSAVIKEWADEVRAAEVRLYVVEQNVPARRCYERNGFRATGRQGVLERNGNIEIEMMWEVSHL